MSKVSSFPSPDKSTPPLPANDQKVQKDTIIEYLKVFGYDKILSEQEAGQFIQTALAGNLDPFKREIYIAVYGEGEYRKVSILTGYQVYLKRAERTGKLDGWHAWVDGQGESMKAVVEIFRKDWSNSFTHEAYWQEAVQKKKDGYPTQFWSKQPRFQLKKVAIAQAFRLAFPDELGSLPYETAELPDGENTVPDMPPDPGTTNDNNNVKTSNFSPGANLAEQALQDERSAGDTHKNSESPAGEGSDASTTQHQQDSGKTSPDEIIRRIENLFETHPADFTQKHMNWILNTAYRAPDKAGILKMLAYTEKVIRKGLSA